MKKRALFVIPIALLLSSGAQAQSFFWGVSYGMSTPFSDTKEFTEGTSWRNMGIDLLAVVNPNTTVGVSFGWNVFNDTTSAVSSGRISRISSCIGWLRGVTAGGAGL